MKKIKLYICASTLMFFKLFMIDAHAFIIPPMIPVVPTLDGITDGVDTIMNVSNFSLGASIAEVKSSLNASNKVKGLGSKYKETLCFVDCESSVIGGLKAKAVGASKDILKSGVADITDRESVSKAFYKLFLVYPTDVEDDRVCYRNQSKILFKDTNIEVYFAATKLEAEIAELEQRLTDLQNALENGGSVEGSAVDAETADNNNTAWRNAYQTYDIMDDLLRMTQELKAMKIQYEVALAIQSKVMPVRAREAKLIRDENKKKKSGDKVSFQFNEGKKYANKSVLMFAQASSKAAGEVDYNFVEKKAAPPPEVMSPFAGNEENLKALTEISNLTVELNEALKAHNLSTNLMAYREVFISYDKAKKLHGRALEMLDTADKCVINYMGQYYPNPEDVWSGGYLGTVVNQHELRKGVSKWLIDSYEMAKSQMVSPLEPEEITTPALNSGLDNEKFKNSSEVSSDASSEEQLDNPIKERKTEEIGRLNTMLPWRVGSEVVRSLGNDQYGSQKWGKPSRRFPVWVDQQNYYNQYINAKYDNIVKYLEVLDLRPTELEITREFNKIDNETVLKTQKETADLKNENWWEDFAVSTSEAEREEAKTEDDVWYVDTKQRIGGIVINNQKLGIREIALELGNQGLERERGELKNERERIKRRTPLSLVDIDRLKEIEPRLKEIEVKLKDIAASTDIDDAKGKQGLEAERERIRERGRITPPLSRAEVNRLNQIEAKLKEIAAKLADIAENTSWLSGFDDDLKRIVAIEDWVVETTEGLVPVQEEDEKKLVEINGELSSIISMYDNQFAQIQADLEKELAPKTTRLGQLEIELEEAEEIYNLYTESINEYEKENIKVRKGISSESADELNRKDVETKKQEQKKLIVTLADEARNLLAEVDEIKKAAEVKFAKAEREFAINSRIISQKEIKPTDIISVSDFYSKTILKNAVPENLKYASSFTSFLGEATAITGEVTKYAIEQAHKTKDDIFLLGGELYYQESNGIVNKRHGELLDELKNISIDKLVSFSELIKNNYSGQTAILNLAASIYQKYMIEKICKEDACYEDDNEYFVSLFAKERDFRAPKAPINEYMPPLREVFYFDDVDYAALFNKNSYVQVRVPAKSLGGGILGGLTSRIPGFGKLPGLGLGLNGFGNSFVTIRRYYVSKHGIINYGGYVPEVWKLALSGKAFVEKDIDLQSFFGLEDAEDNFSGTEFLRGGRYPCKLSSGGVIDVNGSASYFISQNASPSNLPTCQEIEIQRNAFGYQKIVDLEADIGAGIGIGESDPRTYPSELGKIFYWADDYVLYKDLSKTVFDRIAEVKKYKEEDKKYDESIRDEIYDNAMPKQNQLGDFLGFVEVETTYRQSVEKLSVSVEDLRKELFAELRKVGYEPKPNLNLVNDDEFNNVKKSLKNRKSKVLNDVAPKIRSIAVLQNEVVAERLEKVDNLLKALQKDSEELVSFSQNAPTLSELEEAIKTERANQKVKGEYNKEAEEAFQKELKRIMRPYCASYQ